MSSSQFANTEKNQHVKSLNNIIQIMIKTITNMFCSLTFFSYTNLTFQ